MTTTLPQELHDLIVSHIDSSDRRTLLACALVCRAWIPTSRTLVFNNTQIKVIAAKATDNAHLLVSPYSTLPTYLTHITVVVKRRNIYHPVMADICEALSSADRYCIQKLRLEFITRPCVRKKGLPKPIETLLESCIPTLINFHIDLKDHGTELLSMVSRAPNLTRLTLDGESPVQIPEHISPPPTVRLFDLGYFSWTISSYLVRSTRTRSIRANVNFSWCDPIRVDYLTGFLDNVPENRLVLQLCIAIGYYDAKREQVATQKLLDKHGPRFEVIQFRPSGGKHLSFNLSELTKINTLSFEVHHDDDSMTNLQTILESLSTLPLRQYVAPVDISLTVFVFPDVLSSYLALDNTMNDFLEEHPALENMALTISNREVSAKLHFPLCFARAAGSKVFRFFLGEETEVLD